MKGKLKALLCSGILSVAMLSSVAVAAPATLAACNHEWVEKTVETVNVVVESNHECTICGAKINLYKVLPIKDYQCRNCGAWKGETHRGDPEGATFSTHSCYN